VAILSESKQDNIEPRPLLDEVVPQRTLVVSGSPVDTRKVSRHWMDVCRWTRDMVEQRLFRHPVIAAGILGRDVPLISPEDLHIGPRGLRVSPGSQSDAGLMLARANRLVLISCSSRPRNEAPHGLGD
jgi:hypothetical protein